MLRELLERFRKEAKSEREKGAYFERLVQAWLQAAPTQKDQFARVLTFADWAEEHGRNKQDVGIDLCAELAGEPGTWCAVQCKFYAHGHRMRREDIDSFFTASGTQHFKRRIIVDTTDAPWGENAEAALMGQTIATTRIGLTDLEESGIDWATFAATGEVKLEPKKRARQHQKDAIADVKQGLTVADRGKLIMACGTGKTFTALKIAEDMVGKGGRVLYLVPSLALMSQTVREWSIDAEIPLRSFAVCSDVQVGVRRARNDDLADINIHDLEIPATTEPGKLAFAAKPAALDKMTVVFSTYQSIQAIADAQHAFGLPEFDLIVCDEAHRTTGVTLAGDDESNFVRVHSQEFIAGKKRIYMTATPRIYGEGVQATAREVDAALCSMDDVSLYGETLFTRNFSWAVQNELLTDYKVIVLAVDEGAVNASIQARLRDENNELKLDDATKIIGCYRALTKIDLAADVAGDGEPMHRALAFTKDIKSSKLFTKEFSRVVEEWKQHLEEESPAAELPPLKCQVDHVDGTFNATSRGQRLSWLKEKTDDTELCRILSNARCLSEGVDVPALDAIMFLHPRKSQIDVVQSVGRVMRRAAGKRMGYVILPIGVPAGVPPEKALDDNEKYKVVWQILNALRAHDDRLDATINKIEYGANPGDRIEVIAVSNRLPARSKATNDGLGIGRGGGAGDLDPGEEFERRDKSGEQLAFQFDEFAKAILSRIVKKCGTRTYWEDWAKSVAEIARIHVVRLTAAVGKGDSDEKAAFESFLSEIRDDLNDSITAEEAIEMLAQHMITRPVFDALFEGYSFASKNPVSQALQGVLDVLDKQQLEKEAASLEKFYASVRVRAQGIVSASAKQQIVKELYDRFFRTAFPRLAQRMGIVYTPIEVVDFIIKSVNEVLESEFGQTLGSKGVHIIDPFTGTGTFITRLLQSGVIRPEELANKYSHEIHSNEILLLAYYIAAINIEATYHELTGDNYAPFPGICLTDTFQLYEKDDLVSALMTDNSSRRSKQKKLPIRVIIGNPPYSSGQQSETDNNKNLKYPGLDGRIAETYVRASSNPMGKSKAYDSYIRAIRWASDRVGPSGVVAFVCGSAWTERSFADGMRKSLASEFSQIYLVDLRGDVRKDILSKGRAQEGENIFGTGSMTGIVIAILVKRADACEAEADIKILNIGNGLTKTEKLDALSKFASLQSISEGNLWSNVTPDQHGDWKDQRASGFEHYVALGRKKATEGLSIFETYSMGIKSNRDSWVYNSSKSQLLANVGRMMSTYNDERRRLKGVPREELDDAVVRDDSLIKWTTDIVADLAKDTEHQPSSDRLTLSLYRPFTKQWVYSDAKWNWSRHLMPSFFPAGDPGENLAICISGVGARAGFSVQLVDCVPNLHMLDTGQCFPLRLYEPLPVSASSDLFANPGTPRGFRVRDGITSEALLQFKSAYPSLSVSSEDVFYYVYGLLHSTEYREQFKHNLIKELPRIPLMPNADSFIAFVEAGRKLGQLHVGFETIEPYPLNVTRSRGLIEELSSADYYVQQMKFGGKRPNYDRTTIIYNDKITLTGIPLDAYEYVINGKAAIEWVMERQNVRTDTTSGIVNDCNRYADETVGDSAYPLGLLQRVITLSLETMKIVRSLPSLGKLI